MWQNKHGQNKTLREMILKRKNKKPKTDSCCGLLNYLSSDKGNLCTCGHARHALHTSEGDVEE